MKEKITDLGIFSYKIVDGKIIFDTVEGKEQITEKVWEIL